MRIRRQCDVNVIIVSYKRWFNVRKREDVGTTNVHSCMVNFMTSFYYQGPVVQWWVSTNPGLKFNSIFQFLYFYISVYFKTLQTKTTITQDKIS